MMLSSWSNTFHTCRCAFLRSQGTVFSVKHKYKRNDSAFALLMTVTEIIFWDVVPCSLVEVQRCLKTVMATPSEMKGRPSEQPEGSKHHTEW
jgi:hypothetical protein